MCIHNCYKENSCKKREVRASNSISMVLKFFTYVYVYWIRNSGPQTKACACIFSCWDGVKPFVRLQERPPWVDRSCPDCPGFPVLGAGDVPPPELHPGASECAPALAFAFMALRANSWICLPQLPDHPSKNGTHSTCFCSTRGHTLIKFCSLTDSCFVAYLPQTPF